MGSSRGEKRARAAAPDRSLDSPGEVEITGVRAQTMRKNGKKRTIPGGIPLGVVCQLVDATIRFRWSGSPNETLFGAPCDVRSVLPTEVGLTGRR